MANRAPSASASSGAWPKSSQRAPPTNTRARRSAARNSPAGRLPGNSAFAGSGVAGAAQMGQRRLSLHAEHHEPRVGGSPPPPRPRTRCRGPWPSRPACRPRPGRSRLQGGSPERSTGGGSTSAGAEPAGRACAGRRAPGQHEPRPAQRAALQRVQRGVLRAPGGSGSAGASSRTAKGSSPGSASIAAVVEQITSARGRWRSQRGRERAPRGERLDQVGDRVGAPHPRRWRPSAPTPPSRRRRPRAAGRAAASRPRASRAWCRARARARQPCAAVRSSERR